MLPTADRFTGMFDQMDREMRDLMEGFWGNSGQLSTMNFVPSVDLVEKEGEFEVTVDLPGLKPEEVKVEFQGGALWITGERKEEKEEKGKTYHRVERSYGEFRRVLPLPSSVMEEKIEAKFTDGVLKVSVPKAEGSYHPTREAWLPVLHTERESRHYTALFSNTARAHELGTTHDWVVIYRDDDGSHGPWTVITSNFGKLRGQRIVRGRESECASHSAAREMPSRETKHCGGLQTTLFSSGVN